MPTPLVVPLKDQPRWLVIMNPYATANFLPPDLGSGTIDKELKAIADWEKAQGLSSKVFVEGLHNDREIVPQRRWTDEDVELLRELLHGGYSTKEIGMVLKRSPSSVRFKMHTLEGDIPHHAC